MDPEPIEALYDLCGEFVTCDRDAIHTKIRRDSDWLQRIATELAAACEVVLAEFEDEPQFIPGVYQLTESGPGGVVRTRVIHAERREDLSW